VARTGNGDVEIHHEAFGSADDPTLLLVNGLGSQSINYADAWVERFVAEGYQVVRFDNRDTGLSTKLEDQSYGLVDMALDAVAVLDAVGVERAHVMGCSMGGMIVQRLAIDHPHRLLSMTSVMSRTGEPEYGQSSPEAIAALVAPPATSREEYVERMVAAQHVYGSKPEWIDDEDVARRAGASFDRCYCPTGTGRQMLAVVADGSRADALREVTVPTLVLHGSRDTLIDPSGGRRTAELIPGARYEEIEGMGHDYPPAVWDTWVRIWADFAASIS
jgi:pimeloyl-ACP methyl ester carboxylesterase